MEITASSVNNLKAYNTLVRSGMSKKWNPKKQFAIITIGLIIALVFFVLDMVFNGITNRSWLYLAFIIFAAVIYYLCYFIFPRFQYKTAGGANYKFTFTDDEIHITSNTYDETDILKYRSLFQAVETHEYLFIYMYKSFAYIIDKNTISNGTIEDIKKTISAAVPGRYITYNY